MKKLNISNILAFLAIVAALVAAIPSFMSLNQSKALVYYSIENNKIQIPNSLDKESIHSILVDNNIPNNSAIIEISNKGSKKVERIDIVAQVPGKINYLTFDPKLGQNQLYAKLIEQEIDSTNFKITLGDFYEDFNLKISVGYIDAQNRSLENVQVIYDDFKAEEVQKASAEAKWTYWSLFKLPVYILLIGLGLALIITLVVKLLNEEKTRKMFLSLFKSTISQVFDSFFPFR